MVSCIESKSSQAFRTIVPRLATLAPLALTRARATLPKLPSPISFKTSNLSPNADVVCEPGRELHSKATVMAEYVFGGYVSCVTTL